MKQYIICCTSAVIRNKANMLGGLSFLAGCTQEGEGVIQMHTMCNRGGGGV